jgi:GNAT superfamily N-acetyltransferase
LQSFLMDFNLYISRNFNDLKFTLGEIMIRVAKIEDAPRIAEIHIFGWRCAYRGIIPDSYLFSQISVKERLEHFIDNKENESHDLFVYEEDNIIKGFMKIGSCRNNDKKNSFELWGLYVEPLMKYQGIGSKLLEHCEHIALIKGYTENVLWVLEDNPDSRKFYEKHGYVFDGNELIMEKYNVKEIRYCKSLEK